MSDCRKGQLDSQSPLYWLIVGGCVIVLIVMFCALGWRLVDASRKDPIIAHEVRCTSIMRTIAYRWIDCMVGDERKWCTFEYLHDCLELLMTQPPQSNADPSGDIWPTCCSGGWHLNPKVAELLAHDAVEDPSGTLVVAWFQEPKTRNWRTLQILGPPIFAVVVRDAEVPSWAARE